MILFLVLVGGFFWLFLVAIFAVQRRVPTGSSFDLALRRIAFTGFFLCTGTALVCWAMRALL
jgi:hypothetical protein